MTAREADFFGEGSSDQGEARPLTLAEQSQLEDDKRKRILNQQTADRLGRMTSTELGTGNVQRGRGINPRTGRPWDEDKKPGSDSGWSEFLGSVAPTVKAISRDPVTAGVLLAPLGVVGAGAAVGGAGALGVGLGEGTIAGGALPAGIPAMGAPATMASPFAAGGAAGVPAMGTPATMASPFAAGGASASSAPAAASAGWTAKDTAHILSPLAMEGLRQGATALFTDDNSKEKKALLAKQEQLARETAARREQMQTARMDALGQRIAAFNPHNQLMASMFGPQAAFQPEQLAGMVQNPIKPTLSPELYNYQGTDPKKQAEINSFMQREAAYKQSEEKRRNQVMGGVSPLPAGPAPISMPTPQAARKY